ncbi:flagellar hook capping FlgD N-terminal domain-containing protein [Candidatus Contubernalis alkaliaceticus]|uniref:flagellar hook capping FlgD N-terminal domain-containing protein n=1 Tax=Candidatus Contubernalis alkaliaceticus TaxID=338645 RepID=UPI001F4C340C|nr:flagellar hook capping FlgD N-terminal domain-containing protein [Candidatus Contubernalis alkalaceticus]UNC91749.1 flagellar hook capping protein [Candidatus Contubernalis alkalaceticus]
MNTISGITNSYSQQSNSSQVDGFNTLDKNAFMMLLVTQLRYQDPLNPQDNSEFVAQMAQFTSLEQLQNTNDNMEKLLQVQYEMLFQSQEMFQLSLLGRVVTVENEKGEHITGMVTALEFFEGIPQLIVDGQAYGLEQLVRLELGGTAEGQDVVEDSSAVESGGLDE